MQKGAKIIASGNYDYHLKIETNDEIEQLADQFNQMARAIRQREALLEQHRKTLEEMVARRTFELQEEKEKLQAILDNVPKSSPQIYSSLYQEARKAWLDEFEKQFVIERLKANRGNVTAAAQEAGIQRQSFQRLMKKHHIRPSDFKN